MDVSSGLFSLVVFANWGSLSCLLGGWQGGTDTKNRGFYTAWWWSLCGGIHEGVRAKVSRGDEVWAGGPRFTGVFGKLNRFRTARYRD